LGSGRVLVIAGATAVGKSELALACCQVLGGEVISADSATVYRGLDIGSGKPTLAERRAVPHHCLDVRDPGQPFSVAEYRVLAEAAIAACAARGRVPVLAGGTGLYIRQVLDAPRLPEVPPDPALRAELAARPAHELHAALAKVDPVAAARIDPRNVRRVIRALEVYRATGRPISAHWAESGPLRRPSCLVVLDRPQEVLRRRIAARAERMLAAGLVAEVRGLLTAGVPVDAQALQALGYRQTVQWLASAAPLSALREAIVAATAAYARRQRTWFRREPGAVWLDLGEAPARDALPRVLEAWRATAAADGAGAGDGAGAAAADLPG
jgi:tRNA dimethylallyltransferase